MEHTYNQMHQYINNFLVNNQKEKIEKAKQKFQQEKDNEKGFNKKD